jgi:hypothetical protein
VTTTETEHRVGDTYALLLGLAGRVADETLAELRLCLADGDLDDLANLLAEQAGTVTLTEAEAGLVRALITAYDAEHAPDPRVGETPPPPYRFGDRDGGSPPPGHESEPDATDAVAVAAGQRVGGLLALWRVFRHSGDEPPRRVYLAEAERGADLAELTAEIQYALTGASEDTPRVEAFAEGMPLGAYHDIALAGASLVHAAETAPVRLARAFDGATADGPYFDDDHPRLRDADGERVLAYLRSAELVHNTPGAMDDVLDTGGVAAVPVGFRSDGEWVWPDTVAYYLKRHGLAPEPELLAHVLARAAAPGPLGRLTRHRALTTLFTPTGGEAVWQAG